MPIGFPATESGVEIRILKHLFSPEQAERLFLAAAELGVPMKAHVEQLSDLGGARLAARYQALSVDHLEYLNEEDAALLGPEGPVAVLLPGAFLTLGETRRPPIDALRRLISREKAKENAYSRRRAKGQQN